MPWPEAPHYLLMVWQPMKVSRVPRPGTVAVVSGRDCHGRKDALSRG